MLYYCASDGALTSNLSCMSNKTFNFSVGTNFECFDTFFGQIMSDKIIFPGSNQTRNLDFCLLDEH